MSGAGAAVRGRLDAAAAPSKSFAVTDAPAPPRAAGDAAGDAGSGWTAAAAALAPHLAEAAGPGAKPVSIALEIAAQDLDAKSLVARAWVERATRTLVFLGAEARTPGGALAATATAVFRRA